MLSGLQRFFFFLVLNGRLIQYDYSPKGAFQESQDSVWHSYQGWHISIIPLECNYLIYVVFTWGAEQEQKEAL